jgi:nucleoside-triphosphatase
MNEPQRVALEKHLRRKDKLEARRKVVLIMKTVYLLTGRPGVGKTSLIKEVVADLKGKAGGFYTAEIRRGGVREGFQMVTLDAETAVLAHTGNRSNYRVSKYGVDIEALERVGVAAITKADEECDLVVIDEIGKMELFSDKFKVAVLTAINSGKKVLGTIMLNSHPWADAVKDNLRVRVITLTRNNRPAVLREITDWLGGR